ncbi:3-hydroxyacyl-CoA dehydrogenase family protein [Sphingopyxis sp. DBS4]|uniref:3-hydroxyacyl-CoA dehydrogenase family protein n=1 Tax=Sphingopyxis sp. DBS4 TaxID=2968500 RepID=UPI00214C44BD|nr:3-hydroxyacyl-CoA dehydrogenase family protein [Sphingopyxis sp. DBS4]
MASEEGVYGVVGAGLMGAEIAFIQALAGHRVILLDRDQPALDRAMARLRKIADKIDAADGNSSAAQHVANIQTSTEMADLSPCAIITEAVFEDLEVKTALWQQIDSIARKDAMLVTNTSTIPISTLASAVRPERRSRFIGMHYFSPVSRMKLVEVIPAFETDAATVAEATALAVGTGKTPIRVKDVTGFAVNRVLHTFIIEAIRLVEEGVISAEDLDTACKLGLGHPIGPFQLMDAVTSSLCLQAQEIMFDAYGERFRPPPLLKQRVAAGLIGGKGRAGWRSAPA